MKPSSVNQSVLEALQTKAGRNKLRTILGPPLHGIIETDIDDDDDDDDAILNGEVENDN